MRGLPVLEIYMSSLSEYLEFLKVSHDYAYMTLYIHASAIYSSLQPTELTRASMASLVKQLLKGAIGKNPPARVQAAI